MIASQVDYYANLLKLKLEKNSGYHILDHGDQIYIAIGTGFAIGNYEKMFLNALFEFNNNSIKLLAFKSLTPDQTFILLHDHEKIMERFGIKNAFFYDYKTDKIELCCE